MFLTRWLKPVSRTRTHRGAHNRPWFRPAVEGLEAREVPAILTVTTTADVIDPNDGLLSLREAVFQANAAPGPDKIVLPAGYYELTIGGAGEDAGASGDLDIRDSLTIEGAGLDKSTGNYRTWIRGGSGDRAFEIHNSSLTLSVLNCDGSSAEGGAVRVVDGALFGDDCALAGYFDTFSSTDVRGGALCAVNSTVALANADLRGGLSTGGTGTARGGAIYALDSCVTLANVYSYPNEVRTIFGERSGGTIYVEGGSLDLRNFYCPGSFVDSIYGAPAFGGVVCARNADVRIQNSLFFSSFASSGAYSIDSMGGALYVSGGTLQVIGTTFLGNYAPRGGGLFLTGCDANLTNVSITGNGADGGGGGAIYLAGGRLTARNITLTNNTTANGAGGAGLYVEAGEARMSQCTFASNYASSGGGILVAGGVVSLDHCTITGNYAGGSGGGLAILGGSVSVDRYTFDHTQGNTADLDDPDIYDPFGLLVVV